MDVLFEYGWYLYFKTGVYAMNFLGKSVSIVNIDSTSFLYHGPEAYDKLNVVQKFITEYRAGELSVIDEINRGKIYILEGCEVSSRSDCWCAVWQLRITKWALELLKTN